jgi:hypothetical protein
MPMKLKCPACTDAVFAEDADRGTTIKCGTCWADVPVPKAEGGSGAVPPPAKPLPAKPLPPTGPAPVAKALPPTPTAAPVAAKPIAAKPVQPTPLNPVGGRRYDSRREDDRSDRGREKPKYKTRDYDDDDDDQPIRTTSGGGGKGVLIAFICLGLVLAVGVAGGAFLLLRGTGPDTTDTGPAPVDNGGGFAGGGGGGNFPNPFDPPKPKIGGDPGRGDFNPFGGGINGGGVGKPPANKGWVNFRGKGFELLTPTRMTKSDHTFAHDGQFFKGDNYEAREGDGLEVHAWELGAQPVVKVFTEAFVAACTFNTVENITKKERTRPMQHGQGGVEFTTKEISHENGAVLMTATDKKVYVFRIRWKNTVADGEKKKDDFLASIRIVENGIDPDKLAGGPNPPKFPADEPKKPKPVEKPWEVTETKSGFSVLAPAAFRGAKPEPFLVEPQQGVRVSGRKYSVEDDQFLYLAVYFDLPKDYDADLRKLLVNPVVPHFNTPAEGEATKVDGKDGVKLDIKQAHGLMQRGLAVKLGYRQFCFAVFAKDVFHKDDATLQERTDKFLGSVKLAFDPKTTDPYADEPKWVPLAKAVGFGVLVPKNATVVNDKQVGFGVVAELVTGKEYVTDVDGISYTVTVHPVTPKLPAQKVADEIRGRDGVLNNEQVKVNGVTFEHYELKHFFGHPVLFRATAVGNAVFTLKVVRSEAFGKQVGDKEFADKAAKFLNSFRTGTGSVTADEGGKAAEVTPAGEFAQVAAGKVRPFWAAAFLPAANEFVTVGVRDPNATPPGGVLRRYSLPDFKLKATYHLNMPAHRAAADEKGGKLYLAMVSTPIDAKKPEREAAIVAGDIHVYDLKKLLDGSLGDLEQLKPLSVMSVGGASTQVSGLEVSPSGDALFVSAVVTTGTKAKQAYRGKLTRFDTASGKSADLSCEFPVWAIDLAADGRRLAVLERPIDPTGVIKGGTLALVDAVNWRRVKSVPLAGTPLDAVYLGTRPAALENNNGTVRLVVAEPDGENNEIPVDGDPLYVRAAPDGKRVLLAAGLPANGLGLYDVDAAKPPKLTKKAAAGELAGTALGGLAAISPDGKLAVLNCGVVIDLDKSGGK